MPYSKTEFEALYKRIFVPAMRLAISLLHDESEARDVVQEAFIKLWETDVVIFNPEAFVIRLVRNACVNIVNATETRDRIRRGLLLDPISDDTDLDSHSKEIQIAVQRLLSFREQQVIDGIYTRGLSYKDTAETLGVSVATVNKNVVTALRKLRTHFKTNKS